MEAVVQEAKNHMQKRLEGFESELVKLRTGRANIAVLNGVKVDYYGTLTPINQVGNLSTPDAKTILIAPYEKSLISEIEKAIMKADIGLQPTNDGNVVRLPVPQLTEERRKDIVKQLKKIAEETKVAIRQMRREANEKVKKFDKISEDDIKRLEKEIQKHTDSYIVKVDERVASKEKEIMTV